MTDEDGAILNELKFENTLEGATRLVNLARSVSPHVKAVLEPSANYWLKLDDEGSRLSSPTPQVRHTRTFGTSWSCDMFYEKRETPGILLSRSLPEFVHASIL